MSRGMLRPASAADRPAIWHVIASTFRAGETYPIPRDISEADALAYWFSPGHEVFVMEENDDILGTYYLRANNRGGGAHVSNCGYIVAQSAMGRGIARAMCAHSLDQARQRGFRAMQFNFVISTNTRAVKLWQHCGFEICGVLPNAFDHPVHGMVDALIMYQRL